VILCLFAKGQRAIAAVTKAIGDVHSPVVIIVVVVVALAIALPSLQLRAPTAPIDQ
jgi:hypothetical protein